MVLPTSYHCMSLFSGTVICIAISLLFYMLAFALELWWIIESNVSLPLPAYLLCAIYLVTLIIDIFLCVGLVWKKTRFLMVWLFIMAASYLIEGALVLYIIITYWTLQKTNGIIELSFWIFRAIFNVVAYVTILSQFIIWRNEKAVMMRLHRLSLGLSEEQHHQQLGGPAPEIMKKDVFNNHHQQRHRHFNKNNSGDARVTMDLGAIHQGYDNLAFATTTSDLNLNPANGSSRIVLQSSFPPNSQMPDTPDGRMKRSLSSASQLRLQRSSSLYGGSLPNHGQGLADPVSSRLPNQLSLTYTGSSASEFDASSFSGAFNFPVRSQSELSLTMQSRGGAGGGNGSAGGHHFKPRSLMYLDEDDYLTRPPPSRPVSMGYVNVHREFSTQSLDRSRYHRRGYPRKATSLEALDPNNLQDVRLQKLAMRPFDYLNRPGSRLGGMMEVDAEDVKQIEDVAL